MTAELRGPLRHLFEDTFEALYAQASAKGDGLAADRRLLRLWQGVVDAPEDAWSLIHASHEETLERFSEKLTVIRREIRAGTVGDQLSLLDGCPDERGADVERYFGGRLQPHEVAGVWEHASDCNGCRERYLTLWRSDGEGPPSLLRRRARLLRVLDWGILAPPPSQATPPPPSGLTPPARPRARREGDAAHHPADLAAQELERPRGEAVEVFDPVETAAQRRAMEQAATEAKGPPSWTRYAVFGVALVLAAVGTILLSTLPGENTPPLHYGNLLPPPQWFHLQVGGRPQELAGGTTAVERRPAQALRLAAFRHDPDATHPDNRWTLVQGRVAASERVLVSYHVGAGPRRFLLILAVDDQGRQRWLMPEPGGETPESAPLRVPVAAARVTTQLRVPDGAARVLVFAVLTAEPLSVGPLRKDVTVALSSLGPGGDLSRIPVTDSVQARLALDVVN